LQKKSRTTVRLKTQFLDSRVGYTVQTRRDMVIQRGTSGTPINRKAHNRQTKNISIEFLGSQKMSDAQLKHDVTWLYE